MADSASPARLNENVIGLLGAATMGVVMLSPAMTLYGGFGPTYLSAGRAAPLVFIFALLATIPTAISYVLLSRSYPHSGSAAAWLTKATGPRLGLWGGWIVFFYYFTNFVIQPVTIGVYWGDLFNMHGFGSFTIGALLCLIWSGYMVYRGLAISAKGALAFLLFETAIVLGLCLTILFVVSSHGVSLDLSGFRLSSSPTGTSGVFRAMVFAMLAYCGFDVVSTLAEETKMAKKLIPLATILSLVLFSVVIVFGNWCLTYGGEPAALKHIADSGEMPITAVAATFWHKAAILIPLTAISAALGLAIATAVGASRILYAQGRDGLVWQKFSVLHPRFKVPWGALHFIFVGALIASLISGAILGSYNAYVWWGTTSTFFAMLTYALVNLSNILLHREKIFRPIYGLVLYFLVPALGLIIDLYILWRSFFVELWSQGWLLGKSVIAFDLVCVVVALALTFRARQNSRLVPPHFSRLK